MRREEKKELCQKVSEVWVEDDKGPFANFDVKVIVDNKKEYTVKVSGMPGYIPITFKHLKKLAEVFGTEDFDADNYSHSGCETCDYDSSYSHEFTVPKEKS